MNPKAEHRYEQEQEDCVFKKKKKKMLIVGGRELGLNGGHDEVEAIGRARAPIQLRTAV